MKTRLPLSLLAALLAVAVPSTTIASGTDLGNVMFVGDSWRGVILAGSLLGLGLWGKGTFIPMGLVVFLSFVLARGTSTTRQRLLKEPASAEARRDAMLRANPLFIPRNHRVEAALEAA